MGICEYALSRFHKTKQNNEEKRAISSVYLTLIESQQISIITPLVCQLGSFRDFNVRC